MSGFGSHRALLHALVATSAACSDSPAPEVEAALRFTPRAVAVAPEDREPLAETSPARDGPRCAAPLPIYDEGRLTGSACEEDLASSGLTAVDLSDAWVPFVLRDAPALGELGRQPYGMIYRALADERLDEVPDEHDPERALELYGIQPTFRVLLARLSDEDQHRCHDAVDDAPLSALTYTLRPWSTNRAETEANARTERYLRARLGREATLRDLPSLDALEDDPRWGAHLRRLRRLEAPLRAIEAAQAHLVCAGWLNASAARRSAGILEWRTARALATWQREQAIVGNGSLDPTTRAMLAEDSREQVLAQVLRALRERVVDATGIVEDGSAGHAWGTVLGRQLDVSEVRFDAGQEAHPRGAPDHVSSATEAAARALGMDAPARALQALRTLREAGHDRVALRLPPLPRYYGAQMPLRAEIDRGDVWYERRGGPVERRPTLTLYVDTAEGEVALIRWPTTIGGWQPERTPSGAVGLRYKESYVGPHVWREVVSSPAWLPPPSTPDAELIRRVRGRWVPNRALFGPGYHSAYGLVMLVLHAVVPPRSDEAEPTLVDRGIRVHGSVSYRSITSGTSHGCHRLYNHLAVRLAGFVLRHRAHTRHGSMPARYERTVRAHGVAVPLRIESRGYRFELTPPIPVDVLVGRIRGNLRAAPSGLLPLQGR